MTAAIASTQPPPAMRASSCLRQLHGLEGERADQDARDRDTVGLGVKEASTAEASFCESAVSDGLAVNELAAGPHCGPGAGHVLN